MNSEQPADSPTDPKRILVVDDDPGVRLALGKALRKAGYEVEEAADGEEALTAVRRRCPDLLVSDLVIPPPNGQQLASLCREQCPDTPLIFISGYSEDELHDLDIRQVVFLPKPIEVADLIKAVGRLLED